MIKELYWKVGEIEFSTTYAWPVVGSLDIRIACGNMHGQTMYNASETLENIILQINENEIVLPPTVTEIYNDISTGNRNYSNIQKVNLWNNNINNTTIQKLAIEIEPPEPPSTNTATLTVSKDVVQNNDNAHITFLGRKNLQDVINSSLFEEIISQSANYQVEYID